LGSLYAIARALWYFYSVLCVLFVGVLVADFLLVWGIGFSRGVTLYVNHFGEGLQEQLELLSLVPWITVTFIRTVEDAIQPTRKRIKLTAEEWVAFRKWLIEGRSRKPSSSEKKP